jgi:hypothetical protein
VNFNDSTVSVIAMATNMVIGSPIGGGGAPNFVGIIPPSLIPFGTFSGKLQITFGSSPNTDSFDLKASFTLGSTSKGINPPSVPVPLSVGSFKTTIPAGSFKGSGTGPFTFQGTINGVALQVRIALLNTSTRQYSLQAEGSNANLTGTTNPVSVTLTIGNNSGTTSINAQSHLSPRLNCATARADGRFAAETTGGIALGGFLAP